MTAESSPGRAAPAQGVCAERTGLGMLEEGIKSFQMTLALKRQPRERNLQGPNVVLFGLSPPLWLNNGVLGHLIQTVSSMIQGG